MSYIPRYVHAGNGFRLFRDRQYGNILAYARNLHGAAVTTAITFRLATRPANRKGQG